MRLFLLGKGASVTHWLEDAAAAFAADGHQVAVGLVRRPWLSAGIEARLVGPIAATLRRRIRRFTPDLILAIGAFHVRAEILEAVASLPGRAPLVGWVGDVFGPGAAELAARYDLVGHTDSALLARHQALGFAPPATFLPHAVDPHRAVQRTGPRTPRMVFVANPTPERRRVVAAIDAPVVVYGPGWRREDSVHHEIQPRRVAPGEVRRVYRSHIAALNIRNEGNVLSGLNQRNFEPLLAGAALVTDDQPDLERCFDPGTEVLAWRDTEALNGHYRRLREDPAAAAALGARGRRRVLADHTYARRLEAIVARL